MVWYLKFENSVLSMINLHEPLSTKITKGKCFGLISYTFHFIWCRNTNIHFLPFYIFFFPIIPIHITNYLTEMSSEAKSSNRTSKTYFSLKWFAIKFMYFISFTKYTCKFLMKYREFPPITVVQKINYVHLIIFTKYM